MLLPRLAKTSNVVNVDVGIHDALENMLHSLLTKVRTLRNAKRQNAITIEAIRRVNRAEIFRLVIKLEGIVGHADVQLREIRVSGALGENFGNAR